VIEGVRFLVACPASTMMPVGCPSSLCSIWSTAASLQNPLSVRTSFTDPAAAATLASVGTNCSLSLVAWQTRWPTISRLSTSTAAWAL
jgi:hypothetical protein